MNKYNKIIIAIFAIVLFALVILNINPYWFAIILPILCCIYILAMGYAENKDNSVIL